jgi:hypothetical protein
VQLAQRARREFDRLLEQLAAVAGHRQRIGARPRAVGEARHRAGGEAHAEARGAQRRAGQHLAFAVDAEAPHAAARDAVERRVVGGAEGEHHVELAPLEVRRALPERQAEQGQVPRLRQVGAEFPAVEAAVGAP